MDFNKDAKARDTIIFGDYNEEKYIGGIRQFEGMELSTLQTLVDFRFADPKETQNLSPSIGDFIAFMKENPGYVVDGYVVSEKRRDYRVSVEAIKKIKPVRGLEEAVAFANFASSADEFDGNGFAWWD